MNDISVIFPIFGARGEIVAYAGAVSHLPDIGGQLWSATATDVFEEGLQLPPVKLARKGVLDPLLKEIIRANVRLPVQTIADIMSDISSVQTMEHLLQAVLKEYQLKDLEYVADQIIRRSTAAVKKDLAQLPQESCKSEVMVEGIDVDHKISCQVTVNPDFLDVDFAGSSGKSNFGINSPLIYTRAYTIYAAKCVISPYVPNNQGTMDVFKVHAPEDSILNPLPPAACGARHIMGWHAPIAVWRALAQIVPERVVADPGLAASCTIKGADSKGRTFVAITVIGVGGMGARPTLDGLDTTGHSDCHIANLRRGHGKYRRPSWSKNSNCFRTLAVAGKYRGGLGAAYTIRNISGKPAKVAFIANKFRFAPEGLEGGHAGAKRKSFVNGVEVNSMGMYTLPENGTIRMENAGSGGFYDPKLRDRAKVEEDLRNGFVRLEGCEGVLWIQRTNPLSKGWKEFLRPVMFETGGSDKGSPATRNQHHRSFFRATRSPCSESYRECSSKGPGETISHRTLQPPARRSSGR